MRAAMAPAIGLLAVLAACAPDFKKRSEIFDLRILALVPTLLEAGPSESVTVTAFEAAPDGVTVKNEDRSWTFCPFSLGSVVGYACAVPDTPTCQPKFAGVAEVTAEPYAILLSCAAELAAGGGAPPTGGGAGSLPTSIEVLFRYRAVASDGVERDAVLRLPVYRDPVPWQPPYPLGQPWERNRPPAFLDPDRPLTVRGKPLGRADPAPSLAPGEKVEICAPLTGAQSYRGASGEILQEALTVSFYSTAGKLDFDRASAPDFCVKLTSENLPRAPFDARLWAVGRDLRGGQVVAGPFTFTLN